MQVQIVEGDLLDQPVEAIVNSWNQNFIPWWLLLPHGVSGAIKKRAGFQPFWEVGSYGPLTLGRAVATSAGRLPFKKIIHVAGITWYWTANKNSICNSAKNAVALAEELQISTLAFPIIGAGTGGFNSSSAEQLMLQTFDELQSQVVVTVVRFKAQKL